MMSITLLGISMNLKPVVVLKRSNYTNIHILLPGIFFSSLFIPSELLNDTLIPVLLTPNLLRVSVFKLVVQGSLAISSLPGYFINVNHTSLIEIRLLYDLALAFHADLAHDFSLVRV